MEDNCNTEPCKGFTFTNKKSVQFLDEYLNTLKGPVNMGCDGTYKLTGEGWVLIVLSLIMSHVSDRGSIVHTAILVVYAITFSESENTVSALVDSFKLRRL